MAKAPARSDVAGERRPRRRCESVPLEECLLGQAVLGDRNRLRRRGDRYVAGKAFQCARGRVLELGRHQRAGGGEPIERHRIVVVRHEVLVGDPTGRRTLVRIENDGAIPITRAAITA